jgi:hypothetical protein
MCLLIAKKTYPKHPRKTSYAHYSFIIQKNVLIEWATNCSGSPLLYKGYSKYSMLHSETQAYKKAKGLLHKESFEVINIRLNSKGELKISKPCPCCTVFLRNLGCRTIWFSQSYENIFSKVIL